MTDEHTEVFDWGELGEQWWRDTAATCHARSEQQIRFACVRHSGVENLGTAARLAGYAGDADSIRQAGHKANNSVAVRDMLAFAAAENKITPAKIIDRAGRVAHLSEIIDKSKDPNLKIKAIEQMNKMEDAAVDLGRAPDNDGFSEWRMVRDYLQMGNGAPAIVYLWAGLGNGLSSLPLMLDVYEQVMQSDPDLWDRIVKKYNTYERATIERQLSNPDWQIDARIKIWREVGREIVPAVSGMNGEVLAVPSTSENQQTPASRNGHDTWPAMASAEDRA